MNDPTQWPDVKYTDHYLSRSDIIKYCYDFQAIYNF